MSIRFTCPYCNFPLLAPDNDIGNVAPCLGCGEQLQVPDPAGGKGGLGGLLPQHLGSKVTRLFSGIFHNPGADPSEVFASVFGILPQDPLSTPEVDKLLLDLALADWASMGSHEKGKFFERLLAGTFKVLGYQVEWTGQAGDKGVDVLVTVRNRRVAVQAKCYKEKVKGAAVKEVHYGMNKRHCDFCVVITNNEFTKDAREVARDLRCGLIDGPMLPDLIRGLVIPPAHVLLGTPAAQRLSSPLPALAPSVPSSGNQSPSAGRPQAPTDARSPFSDMPVLRAGRVTQPKSSIMVGAVVGVAVLLGVCFVVAMFGMNRSADRKRSAKVMTRRDHWQAADPIEQTARVPTGQGSRPATAAEAPPRPVPPAQTVAELRETLAAGDLQARIRAAEQLGKMGPQAAEGVPTLVDALANDDVNLKVAVIDALGQVGPAAKAARPALLPLLTKPPIEVKRAAAHAVLKIGSEAADAPHWIKAFQDPDDEVSAAAAKALSDAAPWPKEETPTLVELLKNGRPVQRRYAAFFLGAMKADSKPVIAGLAAALRDSEKEVRIESAEALGKIGLVAWPSAAALGSALKDKEPEVRKKALAAIGKIGPNAFNAAPSLIAALRDSDLHDGVVNALVKVGKGAVSDLVTTLSKTRDTKVRIELIEILGEIGPDAKEAIPLLSKIERDDFLSVRKKAQEALLKIQRK